MACIYKNGKYFWIAYVLPNKKRIHKSLKTTSKKEAEKYKVIIEGKIQNAKQFYNIQNSLNEFSNINLSAENSWYAKRWNKFNYREKISILFFLFEGKCNYCGNDVIIPENRKYFKSENRAVIDHTIPVVGGGSNSFDNLVLSCQKCNMEKLDKSPEEYMKEKIINEFKNITITNERL